MISDKQTFAFLQHLKQLHPQAFQGNYIFYGLYPSKGILEEAKEFLPLVIGLMIFVPLAFVLSQFLATTWQLETEYSLSLSILMWMLILMSYVPCILKQAKHSSHSFYQSQRHTPLKLAVIIVLQALNLSYLQSGILQGILFFLAISFGFVRLYKENMFKEHTQPEHYYTLKQLRKACFWSYKQTLKLKWALMFTAKSSTRYKKMSRRLTYFVNLHMQLYQYEHDFCKKHKHLDLEKYLDDAL